MPERSLYKQLLLSGITLIVLGLSVEPIFSVSGIILRTILLNFGIFLVIVATGNLLLRKDWNQRVSSHLFYGLLMIGAGPAFLIYSQIARTGVREYSWSMDFILIYFKLANWWVLSLVGIVFLVAGLSLVTLLWRNREGGGV